MSEIEGKPAEAGSVEEKPVEGTAPATYNGPIEKFKGKTVDEIAQVYGDLESAFGKKDAEVKYHVEKLQAYEQWARTQQQAQPQPAPAAPPDIYDNPQAFVAHAAQPLVNKAVEESQFRSAVSMAPIVKDLAKSSFPDVFDGVDEQALENIMYGGVKSGSIHYSALTDQNAWKMAAWQMKGDSTGYKPAGPQPMNPAQTEQPGGGSKDGEPPPMSRDAREMAEAFGKDPKIAQDIWSVTQKEREEK